MFTAASVDTRVRVLRLLNIIAMVFPARSLLIKNGDDPDLTAAFREDALRTNVENSVGVRSLMDKR